MTETFSEMVRRVIRESWPQVQANARQIEENEARMRQNPELWRVYCEFRARSRDRY